MTLSDPTPGPHHTCYGWSHWFGGLLVGFIVGLLVKVVCG